MTKATETRQLRLLISAVLENHGISDNLELEIHLTEAVKSFLGNTRRQTDPVAVRLQVERAMSLGVAAADARQTMRERVEKVLGLDISGRQFDDFVDFLIAKDKVGQSIEAYAEWAKNNPYDSPKKHQIAQNWTLVRIAWPSAFAVSSAASVDYTGGWGITV